MIFFPHFSLSFQDMVDIMVATTRFYVNQGIFDANNRHGINNHAERITD